MTNDVIGAVTNIVGNLGGDSNAVYNSFLYYFTIASSIVGSLFVIASLDPTNKLAGYLNKVMTVINKAKPVEKK